MVPNILVNLLIVMLVIVIVEEILVGGIVIYNMLSDIIDFDDIIDWFVCLKNKLFHKEEN